MKLTANDTAAFSYIIANTGFINAMQQCCNIIVLRREQLLHVSS